MIYTILAFAALTALIFGPIIVWGWWFTSREPDHFGAE